MSMLSYREHHFSSVLTPMEKKELFRQTVKNVIVEVFSYCNRQCEYCPVSQVDRRQNNQYLAESEYKKIILNLAEIDYAGGLCLNLYNEPTANKEVLLERIKYARKALPKTNIYFSTNGDYLNNEYLRELVEAGLSELYVTLHTEKGKPYQDENQMGRFCDFSVRLGKAIKIESITQGQAIHGGIELHGIPIHVFSVNYYRYGVNRAGLVDIEQTEKTRVAPCDRPFQDFTVSYDGTLFPCCQFFVDNSQHKEKYSIGNIAQFESVFEAFTTISMAEWRHELFLFGQKKPPCDTCLEGERVVDSDEARERKEFLSKILDKPMDENNVIAVAKQGVINWFKKK